jgi:hypothetical protein
MFGKLFREIFGTSRLQCCLQSSKFLDNHCVETMVGDFHIETYTISLSIGLSLSLKLASLADHVQTAFTIL